MEKFEKETLNKYKLWQEFFENDSNNSKDVNEYCLFDKDFNPSCSGCRGGCLGCGCQGCKD
jgi:hypothetical protein